LGGSGISRKTGLRKKMDIRLISQDSELAKACREVLAEIVSTSWTLSVVAPHEVPPQSSDLCIWDFHSNFPIPDNVIASPAGHLFLVQRQDLAGFRAKLGHQHANILLQPYTRVTLAAFLGMVVSAPSNILLRADRDTMLQCLIQTNLKLQEYDQDRTNFLARAVHDFRAPLTAISGYCGLLLGEPLGPLNENQTEVLRRMHHSSDRLLRLATAMFELSVGRKLKRVPRLQKGDMRSSLDQALHEISPFADEKRIAITAQLEPQEDYLHYDGGQIEQVLINILDNACKFTPKDGLIEIRGYPFFWERRGGHPASQLMNDRRRAMQGIANSYRMDFRDSGLAIAQEHLDCIFEEYTSYSSGRDRSGGGLGLAICRSIIDQHEGRVWAENTSVGPMISFVLPLRRSIPHLDNTMDAEKHFETCSGR
jgi:signal transduction histidine kinase